MCLGTRCSTLQGVNGEGHSAGGGPGTRGPGASARQLVAAAHLHQEGREVAFGILRDSSGGTDAGPCFPPGANRPPLSYGSFAMESITSSGLGRPNLVKPLGLSDATSLSLLHVIVKETNICGVSALPESALLKA